MKIKAFFDKDTSTLTYVVYDPESKDAVVIDPVLNFDPLTWSTSTEGVKEVAKYVKTEDLKVHFIIDTHAHADHLSGMDALKELIGARTAISEKIVR